MTTIIEELAIALGYDVDSKALDEAEKAGVEAAETVESRWGKASENIRKGINTAGKVIAGAMAAAAGAAVVFTKRTIDQGTELDTWRKKLGASAVEVGRVSEGLGSIGIESDNSLEALKTLRENLGELERLGTGPARDSLGSLGLTLEDLRDLTLDEQLGVIADAMGGLQTHAERLSIATELMGEDGAALLPAFKLGAEGVRELTDAAEESGRVMTDELVDATVRVGKGLDAVEGDLKAVALEVANELIPAVEDGVEWFGQFREENEELIKDDIPSGIRSIGEAFAFVVEQAAAAVKGIQAFAQEVSDADLRSRVETGKGLGQRAAELTPGGFIISALVGSDEAAADAGQTEAALGRVGTRGARVLTEGGRAELREEMAARDDLTAAADVLNAQVAANFEQAKVEEAQFVAQQRFLRGEEFNQAERDAASGAGGGGRAKTAEEREQERLEEEAAARAAELFAEQFTVLAEQSGAGAIAIEESLKAAAKELAQGATAGVAQEAGLGRLGRLTGQDFKEQRSSLLDEFGVQAILPGVTRGGPQVQITETTNNFTFENTFHTQSTDPRETAREAVAVMRRTWNTEVEGTIRDTKVTHAR